MNPTAAEDLFRPDGAPSATTRLLARLAEGEASALEGDAAAAILAGDPRLLRDLRAHLLIAEALSQRFQPERSASAFIAGFQERRLAEGDGGAFLARVRGRLAAMPGDPSDVEAGGTPAIPGSRCWDSGRRSHGSVGGWESPRTSAAVGFRTWQSRRGPTPAPPADTHAAWATATVAGLAFLAVLGASRTESLDRPDPDRALLARIATPLPDLSDPAEKLGPSPTAGRLLGTFLSPTL